MIGFTAAFPRREGFSSSTSRISTSTFHCWTNCWRPLNSSFASGMASSSWRRTHPGCGAGSLAMRSESNSASREKSCNRHVPQVNEPCAGQINRLLRRARQGRRALTDDKREVYLCLLWKYCVWRIHGSRILPSSTTYSTCRDIGKAARRPAGGERTSTPHNKDSNRWWRKAPQEGFCLIPVSGVIVTGLKARGGRTNS